MKTTVQEITPQKAARILETKNPNNRPLSELSVSRLARDMAAGAFILTHQGIAFDENGDLLDGQHRLAAIVKYGKPVRMLVTTDLPAAQKINGKPLHSFECIDSGKTRGVGQMLQMAGFVNGTSIAAAAKVAVHFAADRRKMVGMSTAQAHHAIDLMGNSLQTITKLAKSGKIMRVPAWAAGVFAFFHTINPAEAERMVEEIGNVTGATASATRALSTYINRRGGAAGGQHTISLIPVAASAIQHHIEGNRITKLYGSDESSKWLRNQNTALASKLAKIIA